MTHESPTHIQDWDSIPLNLKIDGKQWIFVKNRAFNRGRVYSLYDRTQYLRIGPNKIIDEEVIFTRELYLRGFPVPEILKQGKIGHARYYIERSVGVNTLGELFQQEYLSFGKINDNSFANYTNIMCSFLTIQINAANSLTAENQLRQGTYVDKVLEENPDINAKQLENIFNEIETILQILPITFTHGDLSPFNILDRGVIDFEHKFMAPVGYDILLGAIYERFWNYKDTNGTLQIPFDFSEKQVMYYNNKINTTAKQYGIIDFYNYTDCFVVLRAIWSLAYEKQSANESGNYLKWTFRKTVLQYCIQQFIHHERINTSQFRKFS